MGLTRDQIDFHLAEYAALKAEVREAAATAASHFRWAAVSSAAILAWLATQGADLDIPLAVFLAPAAITLLMGTLAAARLVRTRAIREYLVQLETTLGYPVLGWEERFQKQKALVRALSMIGWLALLGADAYAGLALQAYAAGDEPYETRQATTT
ncbi:MAG: hypothetical protein ACXWN9_13630 [Candidatus Binataceae bacterium]